MNPEGRGKITSGIMGGLLILVIFAAPFSIALSQSALALAILLRATQLVMGRRLTLTGLEAPLFLWLGWILVTLPAATDPVESLQHLKRWWLIPAVWLFVETARDRLLRKFAMPALALGLTGVAIYGAMQSFGMVEIAENFQRMKKLPLTTNPMTAGAIMMMGSLTLLSFLMRMERSWRTLLTAIAFALSFWVLILIQCRSCWMGFLGGVFLLLLLRRPRLAPLLPLALILALLFAPPQYRERFTSAFRPGKEYRSNWQRVYMWKTGWCILKDHPVIGIGDRDLRAFYERYTPEEDRDKVIVYGHLHSNLVMFAVLWGVPGLALGFMFLLSIPMLQWKRWRALKAAGGRGPPEAEAWILAGISVWTSFMIAGMFEWYFGDAEVILLLWAITGLSLGIIKDSHAPSSD